MTTSANDTSYWIKFFTDCGVPAGDAANYAVTFTDHRIQRDQLEDLTKEYLNDMGIKILGDVIAILKHAKEVHTQLSREKTLRGTSLTTKRTESPVPRRSTGKSSNDLFSTTTRRTVSPIPTRSTAASRIVGHYIGNDPEAAPMNQPGTTAPKISKELSARLGELPDSESPASITKIVINNNALKEEVPVPKKRRVFPEHEGKYKITMPSGTTAKTQKILREQGLSKTTDLKKSSTVFDRLGVDNPASSLRKTMVKGDGLLVIKSQSSESSVFNRLGGKKAVKRAATSTSIGIESSSDDEEGALGYAGVLKATPSPVKKVKLTKVTQPAPTAAAGKKKKVVGKAGLGTKTAGILSYDASAEPRTLQDRLGKKVASPVVSSTSEVSVKTKTVKTGIRNRLGAQRPEVSSSTGSIKVTKKTVKATNVSGGVFGRLGKQSAS